MRPGRSGGRSGAPPAGRRSGARKRQPKQRARRKARAARTAAGRSSAALAKRGGSSFDSARRAWRRGLRATGARTRKAGPAPSRAASGGWAVVAPIFAFAFAVLARSYRLLRSALAWLRRVTAAVVGRLARLLMPARGASLVAVASAACLVLSQFVYYRGVEIDQPGYAQVSAIAQAPQRDLQKAGEAHSYLLIPLAAFAVAMALVAVWPSGPAPASWRRSPASPASL